MAKSAVTRALSIELYHHNGRAKLCGAVVRLESATIEFGEDTVLG